VIVQKVGWLHLNVGGTETYTVPLAGPIPKFIISKNAISPITGVKFKIGNYPNTKDDDA
jgi:hypothetical protein